MRKRQTLMRAIGRARRAWDNHVKHVTLIEGIPDSYRTVLMFLLRHPGSTQRNIAEFAGITTSAVNQVVKNMQEESYVVKETDPVDKRNCKLHLTEKGTVIATEVFNKLDASDDAITTHFGAEKEAELIALLDELTEYIQEELL
ncbi:MAG: winged helix-turn-helix transcriptional regulator [Ruminococcaceae bacterium]|nr:winged helix-turn-helix transcriptional regulator [Oscillospiraceae bacterium]